MQRTEARSYESDLWGSSDWNARSERRRARHGDPCLHPTAVRHDPQQFLAGLSGAKRQGQHPDFEVGRRSSVSSGAHP